MFISSRTPEGRPNHCPVCGSDVCIEPSIIAGDAPCPKCGCLLWFVNLSEQCLIFEREPSRNVRERVLRTVADRLGVSPDQLEANPSLVNDLGADSLDVVELVMDLEEELRRP